VVDHSCGSNAFSYSLLGGTHLNSPILQGSASQPARFALAFFTCSRILVISTCVIMCSSQDTFPKIASLPRSRVQTWFLALFPADHMGKKPWDAALGSKVTQSPPENKTGQRINTALGEKCHSSLALTVYPVLLTKAKITSKATTSSAAKEEREELTINTMLESSSSSTTSSGTHSN